MKLLIIHPGYPKTATSFLQRELFFKLDDIEFIEKEINGFFIFNKINKLEKKIFSNKCLTLKDQDKVLTEYVSELVELISISEKKIILLSNELILNFYKYNTTLNLINLEKIIKSLKKQINIKIKFMITIRRQEDLLFSAYAASFDMQRKHKSLENFFEFYEKNNNLNDSKYLNYLYVFNYFKEKYNTDVKIFPYELLFNDPLKYFEGIIKYTQSSTDSSKIENYKVGENSFNKNNKYLMNIFYHYALKIHENFKMNRVIYYNSKLAQKVKSLFREYISKSNKKVNLEKINTEKLNENFYKSNKKLANICDDELLLKRFNYF
jgi:hypothetical protein